MKKSLFLKTFVLAIFVTLSAFTFPADAQRRYTEKETISDVTIEYRWQRSNIFKRDSRTILNLRLENNNDYPVKITLEVGFYDSALLVHRSEDIEKCLNPGQRKRGGRAGLRFKSGDITIEDIESDDFIWDFVKFEVEQTDECP